MGRGTVGWRWWLRFHVHAQMESIKQVAHLGVELDCQEFDMFWPTGRPRPATHLCTQTSPPPCVSAATLEVMKTIGETTQNLAVDNNLLHAHQRVRALAETRAATTAVAAARA